VTPAGFLAGDWGTSHLRLSLCDAAGLALESVSGPGAAAASGRFAEVFSELTAPWRRQHGRLPAVLCGMVGSNFGWLQAPYVHCPAQLAQIAAGCVSPPGEAVHIVPGLACRNRHAAPDFLRGEETQILGALQLEPALRRGRQLLCLPGTHTKWVLLEQGAVVEFMTAPTGELFAILSAHSVLVRKAAAGETMLAQATGDAFELGLDQFNAFPQAQLLHRLFECRSRMLAGELPAESTAAFLSGLLIASDVGGALPLLAAGDGDARAWLIGTPQLTALYAAGLARRQCEARQIDGARAALAGLSEVYQQLTTGVRQRAAL
jgi:2-dehydro-3-deoxygalactonokinase